MDPGVLGLISFEKIMKELRLLLGFTGRRNLFFTIVQFLAAYETL